MRFDGPQWVPMYFHSVCGASMLHAITTLVSEFVMLLALLLFGMRTDKIS